MSMKLPPVDDGVIFVSEVVDEIDVSVTPIRERSAPTTTCLPLLSNQACTRCPELTAVGLVEL